MRMFLKAASVFPLRRHLLILVVAAVVPVLVFATIMVIVFGRGERASTERGLRDTTRALTLAVDREIETSMKALEALAASLYLDRDDYNAFERHAGRVLPTQPWWRAIVLTDARGEVILRTARIGARGGRASLAGRPYFVEMTRRLQPALSHALVDAAEALGQGRAPTHTASAVSEVNRLAAALEAAARDRDRFERALRDNEAQLRAIFL